MNRNIRDTFESLSPSEEQKARIYRSIMNRQASKGRRARLQFAAKLAYSLIACLILVTAGGILLRYPDNLNNHNDMPLLTTDNTQYDQTAKPTKGSGSTPAVTDKKTEFGGFILTAYAANGEAEFLSANYTDEAEKVVLTPDVKVLLARYTPAMSSVPGLPFTVDITGPDKEGQFVEAIRVSADSGELKEWNRNTGVVSSLGKSTTIDIGETIYWSPDFNAAPDNVKKITITVEAVSGNKVVGRQRLIITQDEPGYYYATVGELEAL